MITRQELEGKWNEVKGQVQERWGELSDNELQQVQGNAAQLVGVIEQKTGESRRVIEDFLEEAVSRGGSTVQQVADQARVYADRATGALRDEYQHASESVRSGFEHTETMIRRNPVESIAVAFGAGIITGVIVGLVAKSR